MADMREYTTAQEDSLRNLISTTALLLLSSVISGTTAFSLKHEALLGANRSNGSDTSEAVAVVTGVSPPLLDKAMSFFDSVDNWPANGVLNSSKVLSGPEKFRPFQPFLPIQPFTGPPPPPHPAIPVPNDKDQGIYIPQPPEVPEPIQVTVLESQPETALAEPKPPVEIPEPQLQLDEMDYSFPAEVIEPVVIESPDPHNPEDDTGIINVNHPIPELAVFFPTQFGWQQTLSYPNSGPSQQVSMTVTGNIADFSTSSNVNMQVISTDAEGDSIKHIINPSSIGKLHLIEENNSTMQSQSKKPYYSKRQ